MPALKRSRRKRKKVRAMTSSTLPTRQSCDLQTQVDYRKLMEEEDARRAAAAAAVAAAAEGSAGAGGADDDDDDDDDSDDLF